MVEDVGNAAISRTRASWHACRNSNSVLVFLWVCQSWICAAQPYTWACIDYSWQVRTSCESLQCLVSLVSFLPVLLKSYSFRFSFIQLVDPVPTIFCMPYPLSIPNHSSDMSRSQRSPQPWPAYPDIPIYLEANDERAYAKTYGTTPTTPTTPEVAAYNKSTHLSPAHAYAPNPSPVDPSPTTTIQTSSDVSAIWPIPEPPPEIQHQQSTRRPALRFFPQQRPRVRLDSVPTLQIPQINEKTPINNTHPGLGIVNGPPKPPSIEVSAPAGEDVESQPNLAERIEKRLYQYSISGNIIKRWLLEIISWCFSAVCMTAVIAVLIYLKDDPLSKWSLAEKTGLTLNAYISVLSKMAGAALILPVSEALGQLKWSWFQQNSKQMWDFEIFDNASRGPWGSVLLLIRTKGKALAALGAMITLCMMALDPFFQQVVDFPDRWALQGTSSSLPKATWYTPSFGKVYRDGASINVNDADMSLVVEKFAYGNGTQPITFGNGTRPDIPLVCTLCIVSCSSRPFQDFKRIASQSMTTILTYVGIQSCPTSNCTWPAYDTLGVCSQCEDVSDLLTYACLNSTIDWTVELADSWNVSTLRQGPTCGYFLNATSSNPVLMAGSLINDDGSSGETLIMRTLPLTTVFDYKLLYGSGSIRFKKLRNTISDVLIVSAANGTASTVHEKIRPVARECVLSWCVKTIQSSYDSGEYHEQVIETFQNTTEGPSPWLAIPFKTDFDVGFDNYYMQNISIDLGMTDNGRNISGFGIGNKTALTIVQAFQDIFPAYVTTSENSTEPIMKWKTWAGGPAWQRVLEFNPWLAPNNVTRHMERLATAMTNVVRSSGSTEMLAGRSFSKENYVSVRWEWLTLPIGLLFMSFIFLAATIFKSSLEKEQVGVLKNSAILTLLYGVSDDIRSKLTRSSSTGTPRAKAKELKVKLNRNMGWRVSGNLFSPLASRPPAKQPPPGWIWGRMIY